MGVLQAFLDHANTYHKWTGSGNSPYHNSTGKISQHEQLFSHTLAIYSSQTLSQCGHIAILFICRPAYRNYIKKIVARIKVL